MMKFDSTFLNPRSHIANRPITAVMLVLVIGVLLGLMLRARRQLFQTNQSASVESLHAGHEQEKPSIWTCSMHPQIRRDGPGSCPICGMDLVPVKKSAGWNPYHFDQPRCQEADEYSNSTSSHIGM